ncbi:MAG: VOC family protein, partial [Alphaproteobacteria bacterium]
MPETKVKTSGIDHVVLHVSDLKRSRRFYLDVLGMTVAHESSGQTFLSCGAQLVALFEVGDAT